MCRKTTQPALKCLLRFAKGFGFCKAKPVFVGQLVYVCRGRGWHAFAQAGVNYFRPFNVEPLGREKWKLYGCLTVACVNIRTVHIEALHSLTTDSFVQTIARLMVRRGHMKGKSFK
ncbi:hypothetical protein FGIG_11600 [Fasciola gigantica]|uniref:Uncharacterized protein n=1 Tax=Fasciola gigantica TaxID=46835 RepID=A0A504YAL5_FASGI|nr:hypothetical protein FGIG_11600 [Fasciola gigantica]